MSFTYLQSATSSTQTASSTTVTATINGVTAGSLLTVVLRHEGTDTTVSCSDGTSDFVVGNKVTHSNNDLNLHTFYLLAANSGNKTITATFGAARPYRCVSVLEHSYTGGTISFDTQATGAYGTSAAAASGNITTTGTDELCVGGVVAYTQAVSAMLINGVAVDNSNYVGGSSPTGIGSGDYASTFTGEATATIAASSPWCASLMAFKITAGGGGATGPLIGATHLMNGGILMKGRLI